MSEPITREEHQEFVRRMDEANARQSKRIGILEDDVRELRNISAKIERLASSMENMATEQQAQGKRLEALEGRDGKKYQRLIDIAVTAIVTSLIAFVLTQIGL